MNTNIVTTKVAMINTAQLFVFFIPSLLFPLFRLILRRRAFSYLRSDYTFNAVIYNSHLIYIPLQQESIFIGHPFGLALLLIYNFLNRMGFI